MTECKEMFGEYYGHKNPALSGIFQNLSRLILDQEVIQLFTLFVHSFLDYSRSTTPAGPVFSSPFSSM